MKPNSLPLRAKAFAEKAHSAQLRRYTNAPYVTHLVEVAELTQEFGGDDVAVAAALLHDVMEDQGVTKEELVEHFGQEVADLVEALSDMEKGNRKTRKALAKERLGNASAVVQTIKVADLISNTRSIVEHDPDFAKVYLLEKKDLLAVLTKANRTGHKRAAALVEDGLKKLERLPRAKKSLDL